MNESTPTSPTDHLFLCSNRWFSAVSDYCLQLMRFTAKNRENQIFLGAPEWSPLRNRMSEFAARFLAIPLYATSPWDIVTSWSILTDFLASRRPSPLAVWTFEGREQTLCALHRKFHPRLWSGVPLIRVRGQDAPTGSNPLNRWLYLRATDKIVFAADVVRKRTAFTIPPERYRVHHYCAEPLAQSFEEPEFQFLQNAPPVNFERPLFLVLGRYDPIKGHDSVLEAFANLAQRSSDRRGAQLVFIGRSQNVKASELFERAQALFKSQKSVKSEAGDRFYVESPSGLFQVFIFDEQLLEAPLFVQKAHLGIVSSLGSEVICRVAVEFLQSGTPIIATDVGALPEVFARVDMPIFRAGDTSALTEAMALSLKESEDRDAFAERRRDIAKRGEKQFHLRNYASLVDWATSES